MEATPNRVVSVGFLEHDPLLALGIQPVAVHQWYSEYDSGVGPWAEPLLSGERPKVIPAEQAELDFEWIAARKPDLIVGVYASIDRATYDKLSEIAPTVVRPASFDDFAVPYDVATNLLGKAVGRPGKAQELVADTEAAFKQARRDHPEFSGKTAAVGCPLQDGSLGLYSSQDPRGQFLGKLGFTIPSEVDEAADGSYYAQISAERIDMVENYDLLVLIDDCGPATVDLDDHEIFASLDIAKRGDYIYPAPAADALSHGTVLSVSYALDRLVPKLASALQS